MAPATLTPVRKKKIKKVLGMMNKQNKRFIPIAPPLVRMMNLVASDDELDYLLKMGTGLYDYDTAVRAGEQPAEQFEAFFDKMKRKGLVHVEVESDGKEKYRINAIAVGWYEAMMHYLVGKPEEKEFSQKWHAFFKYFKQFNFFPLRNAQDLFLRNYLKPTQDTVLLDPAVKSSNKRKTIPINTSVSHTSQVYPDFRVDELVETFGEQDAIYAFPCVCRHGQAVLGGGCDFEMPKDSCVVFGATASQWASYGYGRKVTKEEALEIFKEVREKGAVHSVIHEKDDENLPVAAICNCCWDCCSILKPYNMGASALMYNAAYVAQIRTDANCKDCGTCAKFCPTTAMGMQAGQATLNKDRCIGCGQCAFQCRQNNIEMVPSERMVYLPILKKGEIRLDA